MSEEEDEPTMEEILSSIRRIISEDGDDEDQAADSGDKPASEEKPEAEAEEAPAEAEAEAEATPAEEAPAPEAEAEAEPAQAEEAPAPEVEVEAAPAEEAPAPEAEAEETPAEEAPTPEAEAEAAPAEETPAPEAEAEETPAEEAEAEADTTAPASEAEADDDVLDLTMDAVVEGGKIEPLVEDGTSKSAQASFDELSALMVAGYSGSGNTLEGLVRELLKPMLKSYLDENLPRIVEDMVEREIARISRKK